MDLNKTSKSLNKNFKEGKATVFALISPGKAGRVRYQGTLWIAKCGQSIDLHPGEEVFVVGVQGITLLVEPIESKKFEPTKPRRGGSKAIVSPASGLVRGPSPALPESLPSSSDSSEETITFEDLYKIASDLDSGNTRIEKHQAEIDKLQQESRQGLLDLAELVEKL